VPPPLNIALLTKCSPSSLGNELARAGYNVWEAISVSEILHLCNYNGIDVVVVEAGVIDPDFRERRITICLHGNATIADLLWELGLLFPIATRVQ
jgi:hypothetical protein